MNFFNPNHQLDSILNLLFDGVYTTCVCKINQIVNKKRIQNQSARYRRQNMFLVGIEFRGYSSLYFDQT